MNPKVGVGYNAQVAVDSKHKLIVEQEVTNAGTDLGLLASTNGFGRQRNTGSRANQSSR
jgi:hypothetical protein